MLLLQHIQNEGLRWGIYSPISCWLRLWMRVCSGKSRTPSHGDRLSPFPETFKAICQHKTRNHCKTCSYWVTKGHLIITCHRLRVISNLHLRPTHLQSCSCMKRSLWHLFIWDKHQQSVQSNNVFLTKSTSLSY